ncbi:Small GTPase superfamily ARF/SAR type [Penicillium verhagenii]|uniref:Small GTPase superfamily ARF/SAR type n=1 Tax=Penicillium verhagenii TaxID=1562060 RepID=UPI002545104D|nr:Small GTPase superfamily ARF/SAR type [Penicillium verhagenii]KAJ5919468.1 Small GTPase superfamily ARF/SAR type [Penicillium verhagenii]KAJ5948117.1 Small GTPase superfamily ARF/SAR type [Penicillium verhagenii]
MLSILRKARLKDKEMRVLMLGLDNAGKTTIVKRIMNEDVTTVSPTLGFIIKTIDFMGYKLNIWDVGGQKTLRSYWKNYFEKTDTLVWVVDATDRLRVEDCREELAGLLLEEVWSPPKFSGSRANLRQRLTGASLLVFLNKTDVEHCMDEEEVRERLGLDSIKTHKWTILPCSAMTGQNLNEGLEWVVQDAKDRLFLY